MVVAASEQLFCSHPDGSTILNLKNCVYYGLDAVGARIWILLREKRKVGDLRNKLLEEYEVDADRCDRELLDLLAKMRTEGLIEVKDEESV